MARPGPRREAGPDAPTTIDVAGDELVPAWLQRLAAIGWRVLATLLVGAVFAAVGIYLSTVTAAILVGVIVVATFGPIDQYLRTRRGWARGPAAAITSVIALGAVILTVFLVVVAFVPYTVDLLRTIQAAVDGLLGWLTNIGAPPGLIDLVTGLIRGVEGWLTAAVAQLAGPIGAVVTILVLGGFLTFYLLEDGDRAWATITENLDEWRKDALTARGVVAFSQVGDYLRGTAILAVTAALSRVVFLLLLGVPFVGPLGVIVFLSGFVPYLGPLFATAVLSLVTLVTRGPVAVVVLLLLIVAAGFAQNRLLARFVYRSTVRVPAAIVLIVVSAGAALFGIGGVFAAVPVGAAIAAFAPAVIQALGADSDAKAARTVQDEPGAGSDRALVPIWLDRLGQWSWRALVVLALTAVAVQLIVVPIFSAPVVIAIIVACAMKPSSDRLRERGLTPTSAALVVTLGTVLVVSVVLVATIVSLAGQLPEIVAQASTGASHLNLGPVPSDLVRSLGPTLIPTAAALVSNVAGVAVVLVTAALLTFFFLRDGPDWWARLLQRVPANRRAVLGDAGARSARIVNGSTVGTGIVSFFGALTQGATMAILGLPLAFPIAVLTFFGGFIPYVGTFITTGLGFLIAVAVGDSFDIVVMAIFTVVFNIVQGNFVAPLVYGKAVSLHPAVVLLAAPIGAAVGGIVGMILVVPVFGVIAATWRSIIYLFDPSEERGTPFGVQPAGEIQSPAVESTSPAPVRSS